jgi:hypothetical protein
MSIRSLIKSCQIYLRIFFVVGELSNLVEELLTLVNLHLSQNLLYQIRSLLLDDLLIVLQELVVVQSMDEISRPGPDNQVKLLDA